MSTINFKAHIVGFSEKPIDEQEPEHIVHTKTDDKTNYDITISIVQMKSLHTLKSENIHFECEISCKNDTQTYTLISFTIDKSSGGTLY